MLAVITKNTVGLFEQRLAVKNEIIVAQCEVGQPRLEHHLVERDRPVKLAQAELEHKTREITQAAVTAHQFDRHHFAQHILERNAGIVRKHLHLENKIARQAFVRVKPVGQQDGFRSIVAGKRQAQQALVLAPLGQRQYRFK